MKFAVEFDPLATKDLKEIFRYVAINDNFESAEKLLISLEESCLSLSDLPERGHAIREIKYTSSEKYLELQNNPYRIIYQIVKGIVYIHAVIDGRRNVRDVLIQRNLRVI